MLIHPHATHAWSFWFVLTSLQTRKDAEASAETDSYKATLTTALGGVQFSDHCNTLRDYSGAQRRFPESRRKVYYVMSIHEQLPPQARKGLRGSDGRRVWS
jgi:hypothetical protein